MIIYGTNGTHVRTAPLPHATCPACHTAGQMRVILFSRYVHIYWVPVLPYHKPAVAQCLHCGADWELRQVPREADGLRQAMRAHKQSTRAPWWQWSALAVLLLGVAWAVVAGIYDGQTNEAYLAAPRTGDLYTIRADSAGQYTLLKVVRAYGNTVEIVPNKYEVDYAQPIKKLNLPDYFLPDTSSLTLLDLQTMKNQDALTDVDRPGE